MTENIKKKLFLFLRLVISFSLIGYIFYTINTEGKLSKLPDYFAEANYWWLALASLFVLSLLWTGSIRWGLLLRAQGVRLSRISVFMYYMIGMFFNNFLPSTVGGDFVKAYYLSKTTGKTAGSFISVLMDRLMGMGGLCVVAVSACLFGGRSLWLNPHTHTYALPIFFIVGGVSLGLVLFFLVVFNDRVLNLFLKLSGADTDGETPAEATEPSIMKERNFSLSRKTRAWLRKIGEKIQEFHQAMYIYKGHGKILGETLLISTGIWVMIVFVAWMVYMAFHGVPVSAVAGKISTIPLRYFFLFVPPIAVIMSIPISFAGLGTREAAFIIFFGTLPGIKELDALIISLTFYFVYLAISMIGGAIYIFKDKLRLHREGGLPVFKGE